MNSLLEKVEIWQLLFDECPIAIACFNQDMEFFLVNDAFLELTSYQSGEIIGESIKRVIPPQFRRLHTREEKKYIESPEKKTNRHGLAPLILDRYGNKIPVDIDLSYFQHLDFMYYVAFIRRMP